MKLWISETNFIEVTDKESLTAEIAVRSKSLDWTGIFGLLPDPDPVLRKTGRALSTYRQLLSDAHIWSCYQSRKSGTLSCEWEISESKKASNKRAFKLIEDWMERLDVYQAIIDMLEAPFFGMSPVEVTWQSNGNWIPESILGKPPEWFGFDDDNRLRFISKENMTDGELLPEYKMLLCRHHATYNNPYGERLLSKCFWPAAFKKGGLSFWSIFAEKFGMPWLIGKVPRGTHDTERSKVLGNLKQMVQDAVAVINNDDSIDIIESKGKTASAAIYEKLISVCNREISKAILGQTLSTELDRGGSYAATKGHMEVRKDIVDQDKRMICQAFNTLFNWIFELNFKESAAPVFGFFEEEDVQKDRAERDKTLSEQGVNFTKKYYGRIYNLEDDDFEIDSQKTEDRGQKTEFAEGNTELDRAIKGQDKLDDMIDEGINRAVPLFDRQIIDIKTFLNDEKSLKSAKDHIPDLYSRLNVDNLAEHLTDILMESDRIGVYSIDSNDFAEAFWGEGTPFAEAIDYFRAKAFKISRISNAGMLLDIKTEIIKSIEQGLTIKDFGAAIDTIFDKSGYTKLNPYRIDTIYRTNMQDAYQAGRYRQMTDGAVTQARPYWRYVAEKDAATRPTHYAMHGKIYPHDHSFWETWYPSNGFNCRCFVQAISARELKREGWKIEKEDSTGKLFEPVDPITGKKMPARLLMPDAGWEKSMERFKPEYLDKILGERVKELRIKS